MERGGGVHGSGDVDSEEMVCFQPLTTCIAVFGRLWNELGIGGRGGCRYRAEGLNSK